MKAMQRSARLIVGLAAGTTLMGTARWATAETVWMEAEEAGRPFRGTLTSPLLIKDSAAASGGSFIEGPAGKDSKDAAPTLGRACYRFSVFTTGSYKVWGRVIAASVEDDSFWYRMDSGAWTRWNTIRLGSGWHWDFIHADNSNTATQFALAEGDHQLCFAYRESGTKLDALVVTSEAFNPNLALSAPPQAPRTPEVVEGVTALLLTWNTVVGATSYTLERSLFDEDPEVGFTARATGLTGHSFSDSGLGEFGYCYRVVAHGPTGTSEPSSFTCGFLFNGLTTTAEPESQTITAPMTVDADGWVGAPAGKESLKSPPSSGSVRWDFRLGSPFRLRLWVIIKAPNKDQDSFWVRVDNGAWIKWNNVKPMSQLSCAWDIVHDSDRGDAPITLNMGQGSHTIEVAYREGGAGMDRFLITDNLSTTAVPGCFD